MKKATTALIVFWFYMILLIIAAYLVGSVYGDPFNLILALYVFVGGLLLAHILYTLYIIIYNQNKLYEKLSDPIIYNQNVLNDKLNKIIKSNEIDKK